MRQGTLFKARQMFDELESYPDERIQFHAQSQAGDEKSWSRLMDDVWDHVAQNPPDRMLVHVKGAPGDDLKCM